MKIAALFTCFCLYLFIDPSGVMAEGTKEVMPNPANGTGLVVSTTNAFPLGKVGSYLGSSTDNRIYFRIKDYTKENLYYGFHWLTLVLAPGAITNPYTDVYMNVYDPNGVQVATIKLPTSGAGYITSYASAAAGPVINGLPAGGYTPSVFNPAMNGDYSVVFYRGTAGNVQIAGGESMLSVWFDMTVAEPASTPAVVHTGRLHCNLWALSVYNATAPNQYCQNPLVSSNAQFYAYTSDSVITKISLPASGFEPLTYLVAVNHNGVQNTGAWLTDRQSQNVSVWSPSSLSGSLFNIFFNTPDPTLYAVAPLPLPPTLVNPIIAGCPPGPYSIRFYAPQVGDYYMMLDLNGVPGFQAGTADRFIELVSQAVGVVAYSWDGKNGLGNPVPANTTFPIIFSFRKGRINIPFYDVELNINGFSVDAVSPVSTSGLTLYWDDTQLSNIGTTCTSATNNNNLTGIGYANTVQGQPSPGHAWSGNGNSGFVVPAPAVGTNATDNIQCNDFGNARLINTWAWGLESTITQNLTLACVTVSGTVWDDADNSAAGTFTNIQTNMETGANAGLYASLVDPVTNNVLSTVAVSATGTYTLTSCPINATGMKVVISTTAGTVGSTAPAPAIPSAWVNTSPLLRNFNTSTSNITGIDFGIERLPDSDTKDFYIGQPALNSYQTLNGVGTIASPGPLSGSDPEDGILGSGKTVVITGATVNGELYYNGILLTANSTITNYNPALLRIKYTTPNVLFTSFQYAYVDAGGKQDPLPATYTINFSWPLQTTLSLFTAKGTNGVVQLNWTSEDETNGIVFIIERSADGLNFGAIGRLEGTNTGVSVNHSFTDTDPKTDAANYYRLRLTDNSGKVYYSDIKKISSIPGRAVAEVSPNPFKDRINVTVSLEEAGRIAFRLLDNKGGLLQKGEYAGNKGSNSFQVGSLSLLPVSVYFIQIVLPDRTIVQKVFNH